MPRRGENIRKRKDGRWEGRYGFVESKTGRYISHSVYAKTYTEVRKKLAAAKEQNAGSRNDFGKDRKEGVNFGSAASEWLTEKRKTRKYSTYVKYSSIYRKYLEERLGTKRFFELDSDIVQREVMTSIEMGGNRSESLYKSICCVVNQIAEYAGKRYGVKIFRCAAGKRYVPVKPVETLDRTEQSLLIRYLYREPDIEKLGIMICLSTGLRLGEICALKWEDVDLLQKVIHVNSSVQRIASEESGEKTILLEGEPKSFFSKREIPISEELTRQLVPYSKGKGYVLCGNKPMEPRTYQNHLQKYLKNAGIGKKNFHMLRHTFATNCIDSGVDIKSLSEILGHADVKITLNNYVHPSIDMKRHHMDLVFSVYDGYRGKNRGQIPLRQEKSKEL